MTVTAQEQPRRYSVSDYLDLEQNSIEKHEYRDGELLSMAGGSYYHSLIAANLIRELGNSLKGKPCRVLESNLRVRIPRKPLFAYPDATVICGKPQFDPDDPRQQTITNPRLLIEILSPSTEGYDRGEKFSRYRDLETLQEYVLVAQDLPRIEMFFRQSDGTWLFHSVAAIGSIMQLKSIDAEVSLNEIYAGVEFPGR